MGWFLIVICPFFICCPFKCLIHPPTIALPPYTLSLQIGGVSFCTEWTPPHLGPRFSLLSPCLFSSTVCSQRKVIGFLELPLLIRCVEDLLENRQVSEAQLGVWQGLSPTSACGLIRGCFLLLGGVEGQGTGDVCLWLCVLRGPQGLSAFCLL